ncbi:hypothetical protein [Kribbella soli]|uniref:Uncharacterized protein n=1 Tax=Kribbella soli TaxID=1124743 RepID=A0A4R0H7T8_9ACTN|nr:hypothetical protein [Kribbella soli]TCC04960.1 hypothetical protein E0H45_23040 [Kribbella soli]
MAQLRASQPKTTSAEGTARRTITWFVIVSVLLTLLALVGVHFLRGEGTHVVDYRSYWSGLRDESMCRDLSSSTDVTVSDGGGRVVGAARGIRGRWDGGKCWASTKITVFDADMYSFRATWTNVESREDKERIDTISRAELESKGWVF